MKTYVCQMMNPRFSRLWDGRATECTRVDASSPVGGFLSVHFIVLERSDVKRGKAGCETYASGMTPSNDNLDSMYMPMDSKQSL